MDEQENKHLGYQSIGFGISTYGNLTTLITVIIFTHIYHELNFLVVSLLKEGLHKIGGFLFWKGLLMG